MTKCYQIVILVVNMVMVSYGSSVWAAPLRLENKNSIIDSRGVKVELPASGGFRRIISLYGAHTQNLATFLGASDRLVGVSKEESELVREKFSLTDGFEKYVASKADLILLRGAQYDGKEMLFDRLTQMGIKVAVLAPRTKDELLTYFKILGLLVDHEKEASAMVSCFESELKNLSLAAAKAKTKSASGPKKVFFESQHKTLRTFTPDSLPIFMVETAGAVNIAKDASSLTDSIIAGYGKEQLILKGGEIELYIAQKGPMNDISEEEIKSTPALSSSLSAIKRGEILIIDEALSSRPTPRLLEGARLVASKLYPSEFKDYQPVCSLPTQPHSHPKEAVK
jgi:iron complex transport system substrate-binding protein